MILVISSPADAHTAAVMQQLGIAQHPALLLDLSQFPQHIQVTLGYRGGQRDFRFTCPDGTRVRLDECHAVWWRRPQAFQIDPAIVRPTHRSFSYAEALEAINGLWQALDAFWINHPTRDEVAARKVYQLRIAQDVGLDIPATVVTNDAGEARRVAGQLGCEHTVYKAFSATQQEWRETRVLRPEEMALLENVRFAPVIFQEYIPAEADLRITIVGEKIFPAAIRVQNTSYPVDFRMDFARAPVTAWDLPPEVGRKLRTFMNRLGLIYGAIDMRLTPDGRYVFLEVNPAGQWLFIEQRTQQPITAAVSELLALHDAPQEKHQTDS